MMRSIRRRLALFPLWPLLVGVIAGVCLSDQLGLKWWLAGSVTLFFLALIARRLPVSCMALGIILGYGLHGQTVNHQRSWLDHTPSRISSAGVNSHLAPCLVNIHGIVVDTGSSNVGPYLVRITEVEDATPSGSQLLPVGVRVVLIPRDAEAQALQYGDRIEASGSLEAVAPLRNPYGFDRARWRHRQGADTVLTTYRPIIHHGVSAAHKPVRTMSRWRLHLRDKMTAGLDTDSEQAQLIRAVVLGERPPRSTGMIEDFRNSGTLHVFAVSGLHVGMVGLLIALVLGLSRAPRWLIILLTIIGMILYAGITGLRPPAVRAVIMATVYLSGFLIQRRPSLINSLAASAIIVLLWDGHQLFTPGFQLSYGVLFAIALLARFCSKCFRKISQLDPFMPRLLLTTWQERRLGWREKIQASLSVSCAAWLGSSPLIWLYFGIVTPISIFASLLLISMVFTILGLAMFSLCLGSIWSPAGEKINHLNAMVASLTHGTAAGFARIPGGHLNRQYLPSQRPQHGRIIVFDVPDGGGANLIDIGGGVLLDSGRSRHFRFDVLPTLSHLSIQPDSLIITHADSNHCGGMNRCLTLYHPKQAIIPRLDQLSPSYRRFINKAQADDCRLITPHLGQTFPLDSLDPSTFLEILHAPAELDGDGLADDTGLILLLHWRGWRILFTGDAGLTTESRLLDSGIDLHADVIIMGRNRDDITGHLAFMDAVSPRAIISSHGQFPENERIPSDWQEKIAKRGIVLFDQKLTGAVTLDLDDDKLTLTPMLPTATPLTLEQ